MMDIVNTLVENPQLLAAILAVIYNLAGYVMSLLQIKGMEKYQITKLVETLVLFEALFLILSTLSGVPVEYTAAIALVVAVLRSLMAKLKEYTIAVKPA